MIIVIRSLDYLRVSYWFGRRWVEGGRDLADGFGGVPFLRISHGTYVAWKFWWTTPVCLFRSWRVRWSIANKFYELCSALGGQVTNDTMCDGYEALLQDSEAEVKT